MKIIPALALAAILAASPATAGQLDYLLGPYSDESSAKADPALAPYCIAQPAPNSCAWDMSRVYPGLQIWDATQDGTSTVTGPGGQSVSVVTHQYQAGFSLVISLIVRDPALEADAAFALLADRDAANAGQAFILLRASAWTDAALAPMRLQPTPLGASYPFGAAR